MKLIPSYQEFVDDMSLNGKISPELAESLAADFKEIEFLNEGFLDSIKNTLSKTFLGSLSYINMIDKVRESILKDQKDLLTKKYSHSDEIDSLNASLKQAQKSKDSVKSDEISKTISNKENEYKTYVNMLNKRIERAEDAISKIIEGNKRRSEYYDAGKSQDELTLAEFEYKLAKARTNADPQKIRDLEIKVKDAKEEAEEAQQDLKLSAEKQAKEDEDEKLLKKSALSTDIDEIESAIERYEKDIEELKIKRIQSRNKRLSTVDQDALKSKESSLKLLKNKKKSIEKAMKGSKNRAGKIETKMPDFLKNRKNQGNTNPQLKVVPGDKSNPTGARAASRKKS